jgi:hypothetical protein
VRAYVLLALAKKEARRVALHRGTVGMLLLLLVASALLSALGTRVLAGALGDGAAPTCVVDVWEEGPWVSHLESRVPSELRARIQFRRMGTAPGMIRYPSGAVGLQLRPLGDGAFKIWTWHAPGEAESASFCEAWFWRETRRHFLAEAPVDDTIRAVQQRDIDAIDARDDAWALREAHARFRQVVDPHGARVPRLDVERSPFRTVSGAGAREALAMGLALLSLFFVGIFLLPSMTSEERERGLTAAIALSPASAWEVAAVKLAFYFALAFGLAAVVSAVAAPAAMGRPFFWATLAAVAVASVSIGMTIASLARTQRAASLGALSYLFAAGVLLVAGKGSVIEPVTWLLVERHGPELLLVAFAGTAGRAHWSALAVLVALACGWLGVAFACHRRFGTR